MVSIGSLQPGRVIALGILLGAALAGCERDRWTGDAPQGGLPQEPVTVTRNPTEMTTPRPLAAVDVREYGASGEGLRDDTASVNAALASGRPVYCPSGIYLIDPDVGIKLQSGSMLLGAGWMKTVFLAAPRGASVDDLAGYRKGSVIRRPFALGIPQDYVTGCYLSDFAIILSHSAYRADNYRQIGLDLRNITRSTVERVYVGNETVPGMALQRAPGATDRCQGYGIVLGSRSSGLVDYAGGEVNVLRDCRAFGLYKNIAIDDAMLSPSSAAHGTTLENCEVQHGHELLTQESSWAGGISIRDFTIQGNDRQQGNPAQTVGISISGYGCRVHVKYSEMSYCDIFFRFSDTTKHCVGEVDLFTSTPPGAALVIDQGSGNTLRIPAFR